MSASSWNTPAATWPAVDGQDAPRADRWPFLRRAGTCASLAVADASALTLSGAGAVLLYAAWLPELNTADYLRLWPRILSFLALYSAAGLYRALAQNPVEELRRCTLATSLMFPLLALSTFLMKDSLLYSRALFLLCWAQALFYIPLGRLAVRMLCCRMAWWGRPVAVIGAGAAAEKLIQNLRASPQIGLRPVAVLEDEPLRPLSVAGVPVVGDISFAPRLARAGVRHAIFATPELPHERWLHRAEGYSEHFPDLLLLPNLEGLASLSVETTDLNGLLGLQVRQQLLSAAPRVTKTVVDRSLTIIGGLLILPLIGMIALLVRLTTNGPVFFKQQRIGRDGQPFAAWKFCSMVPDAEAILQRYLDLNPALRAEWERDRKLRKDPRITPIGRILRRTSLDELPQLWNVLRGEMSLVGPRPIVQSEVRRYGDAFRLYQRVTPGITGLWQVSGRNNTTYAERVRLDVYYVRNWSVWLDLYILARTFYVVLKEQGAY